MLTTLPLPNAEDFGKRVSNTQPKNRTVQRLYDTLRRMNEGTTQEQHVQCLLSLLSWLRGGRGVPPTPDAEVTDSAMTSRLRLLLFALETSNECRDVVFRTLTLILQQARSIDLFARLGLPEDRSFLAEMSDRFWKAVLPVGQDDEDAIQLLGRAFPSQRSLEDLGAIPSELWRNLIILAKASAFAPGRAITAAMLDALQLVALRISASGLFDALRSRSPETSLEESPFFQLPRVTQDYALKLTLSADREATLEAQRRCLEQVGRCREVMAKVVENLESSGVSVDVVYRLEAMGQGLTRYCDLVAVLLPARETDQYVDSKRILSKLIDARLRDGELMEIVRSNLHLLARRIIERAGETGEHYITNNHREYFKLLASAAGGGVLTCVTTVFKYGIVWVHAAPFVEGVLSSVNYAGSFLIMQFLGFTLATKQPSMTAAAVAASMREQAGQKDLSGLVTMIARVTRSQLAAAVGNLGLVIPTAALFDLYWRSTHHVSFLDPETASYVLHSLSLFGSGTVYYAALTGVLLWSASIGAGWFENWVVYQKIPKAIETHRLRRWIGQGATTWASKAFHRNVSGVGGNVTLGVLLGMTPVVGKFLGVPLDVRHVTLSTGALTLAVCAQGRESLSTHEFRDAVLGVLVIGVLNFGVSFILALLVALRAKEVGIRDRFRLLVSVVATLLRAPLQFVFPPVSPRDSLVHGPVSLPPGPPH
jgi:site-specific recombinase